LECTDTNKQIISEFMIGLMQRKGWMECFLKVLTRCTNWLCKSFKLSQHHY